MIINPELHNEYVYELLKSTCLANGIIDIPSINDSWSTLKNGLNPSTQRAIDVLRSMLLVIGDTNG